MKRFAVWLLMVTAISGCAFHRTPYLMYEGNPPLSSTTVFASFDDRQVHHNDSRITAADGKKTSCFEVGCPYWVRLLPGTHKFEIRYASNFRMSGYTYANLEVEVPDMKAGHVYVARYRETGSHVYVHVEDLGLRPHYGIALGLEGMNKKFYPVEFD